MDKEIVLEITKTVNEDGTTRQRVLILGERDKEPVEQKPAPWWAKDLTARK